MMIKSKLKENWLLKKIPHGTFNKTIALIFLQFIGTNLYLHDFFQAHSWMPASGEEVFKKHEYWRLWTTLFTHADATHILSNMVLFFPFAYFLIGFYGSVFFPLFGFLVGGLTNLVVLKTMPEMFIWLGYRESFIGWVLPGSLLPLSSIAMKNRANVF